MKNYVTTCLMNVALVAIFAILAMQFQKWWIVLFVYLIIIAANPGEMPPRDDRPQAEKDARKDKENT